MLEEVRRRHEVGVKDSDEFPARVGQPRLQSARFVALAVDAPILNDVDPLLLMEGDAVGDDLARIVRGVVQQLNLEPIRGPVESGDRVDQAPHDVAFIVDRKLHGYAWRFLDRRGGGRGRAGPRPPGNEGQKERLHAIHGEERCGDKIDDVQSHHLKFRPLWSRDGGQ